MKGQNIPAAMICLFHICATLWGFTEQEEVTGLFSKDCILPCRFPPGHDEVIHWSKENRNVHSYYQQKDQLEKQDPYYRFRTHLFHENIPSGNASLKLSSLTMTDEGSYTCYVGTAQHGTEVEVQLHVKAPSSYALEYQKTNTERRLKCYAFLTYPAPTISWVQGNISIQETDREETRNGVLYSLRSDKDIVNVTDTYYCHIHLDHEVWSAEWKMQGRNEISISIVTEFHSWLKSQTKDNLSAVGQHGYGTVQKDISFSLKLHLLGLQGSITSCFQEVRMREASSPFYYLPKVEGESTVIPCEHGHDTASADSFTVVWTLHRNAVTSVLASFNGTSHSHQPRVQVNESDFSLRLDHLTAGDSGEYLCNISTPLYTKLAVTTLHIENSGNTGKIVLGVLGAVMIAVAIAAVLCYLKKKRKRGII